MDQIGVTKYIVMHQEHPHKIPVPDPVVVIAGEIEPSPGGSSMSQGSSSGSHRLLCQVAVRHLRPARRGRRVAVLSGCRWGVARSFASGSVTT